VWVEKDIDVCGLKRCRFYLATLKKKRTDLFLSVPICPYLFLSVPICPYLSLSVLILSVPICPYLFLSVPICPYLSLSVLILSVPRVSILSVQAHKKKLKKEESLSFASTLLDC